MSDQPDQFERLLTEALELPTPERARLAAELIASVDGAPDADAHAAWTLEIDRRIKNVQADGAKGDNWQKVHARIAARLRSR